MIETNKNFIIAMTFLVVFVAPALFCLGLALGKIFGKKKYSLPPYKTPKGNGNGYGYIYGYGESEGNIGGKDFFNVFCLNSCRSSKNELENDSA